MALTVDSCKVRLLPLSIGPHINDSFTPRYLSHQINRMTQKCVQPPPHIGGEGGIGSKDVIGLAVAGLAVSPATKADSRLVIEQEVGLVAVE